MHIINIYLVVTAIAYASSQPTKCDQKPPLASSSTPSKEKLENFQLTIVNVENENGTTYFIPAQTYVLKLESRDKSRPFRWFMITAEDPNVDDLDNNFRYRPVDVGDLKTLEKGMSRYSERCPNSVENSDNTEKTGVEIHWVSPEDTDQVRIRAMVAENAAVWYTGGDLEIILTKNNNPSRDSPPLDPSSKCNLTSEARYEVIFYGAWSRLTHPLHYPSKPDQNGYSHMIGASHDYEFTLWAPGTMATPGLQLLAESSNTTVLEREIIGNMSVDRGTRTLIRGKRRLHPHMSEPSHSLFRVDSVHHMISIAIGMRPSPDWFLGTFKFELCTDNGWLEYYKLPLYPWDAGTMDGVSYESATSVTQPTDSIDRVEVGSFDENSPFFQTNLNDLKPFAHLEIRRLDVYDLRDCTKEAENEETGGGEEAAVEGEGDEEDEEPEVEESRQRRDECHLGQWGEWSPCVPDVGDCGIGAETRTRQRIPNIQYADQKASCRAEQSSMKFRVCFINC